MDKIAIFGSGGHGREVADMFNALNHEQPDTWDLCGFLSEEPADWETTRNGVPVLGGWEWLLENRNVKVVIAIGDSLNRARIAERLDTLGIKSPAICHPSVFKSNWVWLGAGTLVGPRVTMTNQIQVGRHVLVNTGCSISHDCQLADYATLSPGVHLAGRVRIGAGAFLGIGAVVLPKVSVGAWAMVGAGAVVTRDVPSNATVVGVPAVVKSMSMEPIGL